MGSIPISSSINLLTKSWEDKSKTKEVVTPMVNERFFEEL